MYNTCYDLNNSIYKFRFENLNLCKEKEIYFTGNIIANKWTFCFPLVQCLKEKFPKDVPSLTKE